MNIAGESAGRKNRCSAFNIPITATATATVVRNGIMIRVSWVVSSSLPSIAANSSPEAIARVMGSANTIARTTIAPVTTSSVLMTRLPRRHAASRPRVWRVFVNVGTKAAVMAPSAKRSRTRLGTRNATLKASMAGVAEAPNRLANTISRTTPSSRLAIVAIPMRPADRASRELIGSARVYSEPAVQGVHELLSVHYSRSNADDLNRPTCQK